MADEEFTLQGSRSPLLNFAQGTLGSYTSELTSGWSDELVASLLAPSTVRQMRSLRAGVEPGWFNMSAQREAMNNPEYSRPEDLERAFEMQLESIKEGQKRFNEEHPIISTIAGAGGIINQAILTGGALKKAGGLAIAKLPQMAASVLNVASKASLPQRIAAGSALGAGSAAVQGFIQGAGEAEGGLASRGRRGLDVMAMSIPLGALTGGMSSVFPVDLNKLGTKEKRAAIGVTRSDYKKSMENVVDKAFYEKKGKSALGESLARLEDSGVIDIDLIKDPQNFKLKVNKMSQQTGGELKSLLKEADDLDSVPAMSLEDFKNTTSYSQTGAGTAQKTRKKVTEDELETILEQYGVPQNLQQAQKMKTDIYKEISSHYEKSEKTAENSVRAEALRYIARDLKEYIEKGVDNLAEVGKLSIEKRGAVRALNQQLGDLQELTPYVIGMQALKESGTLSTAARMLTRTTMGGGAPIVAGSVFSQTGNPLVGVPLMLAGAGMGAMSASPQLQYRTGQGLSRIASLLEQMPKGYIPGKMGTEISSAGTNVGLIEEE